MSTGRQFNTLEARLFALQRRVRQIRLTALGAAQSPGSGAPEDPTAATRIRRLARELSPILKDLDQIAHQCGQITHSLEQRDRLALRIGREQRYRARQSVRDLQARGREVYQLIDDIREDIARIVDESGTLTDRERIELINTAMEKVGEFAGHLHEAQALLSQPAGPEIAAPQVTVNVSVQGLLLTIYVMVLYLIRKGGGNEK